jgi:hypothetical protein
VQALPVLLQELKARGYKIVHVVQAGPSHPKTASEPEQWAARHEHPSPWPRIEIAAVTFPSPALTAPSLQSFAVGFRPGAMVPATLSGQPGMLRTANGDVPAATLWERSAIFTQVPETAAWASPAAENFRYARKPRSTTPALPVAGTASPTARLSATAVVYPVVRPTPAKGQTSLGRGRSTGHQLMLAKPMAHLRATLPTVR